MHFCYGSNQPGFCSVFILVTMEFTCLAVCIFTVVSLSCYVKETVKACTEVQCPVLSLNLCMGLWITRRPHDACMCHWLIQVNHSLIPRLPDQLFMFNQDARQQNQHHLTPGLLHEWCSNLRELPDITGHKNHYLWRISVMLASNHYFSYFCYTEVLTSVQAMSDSNLMPSNCYQGDKWVDTW